MKNYHPLKRKKIKLHKFKFVSNLIEYKINQTIKGVELQNDVILSKRYGLKSRDTICTLKRHMSNSALEESDRLVGKPDKSDRYSKCNEHSNHNSYNSYNSHNNPDKPDDSKTKGGWSSKKEIMDWLASINIEVKQIHSVKFLLADKICTFGSIVILANKKRKELGLSPFYIEGITEC
jgi:hypothetical protein